MPMHDRILGNDGIKKIQDEIRQIWVYCEQPGFSCTGF